MKIDIRGFSLRHRPTIPLKQIYDLLVKSGSDQIAKLQADIKSGTGTNSAKRQIVFFGYRKHPSSTEPDPWLCAWVMSRRDAKTQLVLQMGQRGLEMASNSIGADRRVVEANFAVICPRTGRGIYARYPHSTGLPWFLKTTFERGDRILARKTIVDLNRQLSTKALQPQDHAAKLAAVKQRPLDWSYLVKNQGFEALVATLERISELEVSIQHILPREHTLFPLSELASKDTYHFSYASTTPKQAVQLKLKSFLSDLSSSNKTATKVAVTGYTHEGRQTFNLDPESNIEKFLELDYDLYANHLQLELDPTNPADSIAQSKMIGKLLEISHLDPSLNAILTAP